MPLIDDLSAEGEPEKEFNPGIAERLPRKRTAAGTLVRDDYGRILFLVPTYKPQYEIPGGIVEEDESPLLACQREVCEEIGLSLKVGRLLVVDWVPRHGVWGDALMFIFDGGVLTPHQIEEIKPSAEEVSDVKFLELRAASDHLRPSMKRRLAEAVEAAGEESPRYLEFGRRPKSVQ